MTATTHVCVAPTAFVQTLQHTASSSSSKPHHFLRLPHPRSGVPSLFLIDHDASRILEVQAVAPDSSRSWFTGNDSIIADGKLLMFTPIDAIFLLLPVLLAQDKASSTKFRPLEDIFEDASAELCSKDEKDPEPITPEDLNRLASLECVRKAAERICEFKEITEDITVYRYSPSKLLDTLRTKVDRISSPEAFDSFQSLARSMAKDGLGSEVECKPELRQAGRTRAACGMLAQYLPQPVLDELVGSYDFTALDAYLKSIRDEDKAANAPITNIKDTDSSTSKGGKKAAAADKKGAKAATRGVQQLAKANVQGMAKLSTFFTKKEKAK